MNYVTVPVIHVCFLTWHILSILRQIAFSQGSTCRHNGFITHGCVYKGCVRANTESDTHLLKLLCINTPHLSLHSFVRYHLTWTHTQTQNWCNESTRMCLRERWITRVGLMKISPMQAQPCSTDTHTIYARALMLTESQSEGLQRKSCMV